MRHFVGNWGGSEAGRQMCCTPPLCCNIAAFPYFSTSSRNSTVLQHHLCPNQLIVPRCYIQLNVFLLGSTTGATPWFFQQNFLFWRFFYWYSNIASSFQFLFQLCYSLDISHQKYWAHLARYDNSPENTYSVCLILNIKHDNNTTFVSICLWPTLSLWNVAPSWSVIAEFESW